MVLKRMRDIFVANVHEGLNQLEKPVVMLNQYLRDMEEEINHAKQAIIKQKTIAKNFERQKDDAVHMTDKRQKQAELALDAGEEQLARRALMEKKQHEAHIEHYQTLHEKAEQQVRDLKDQLNELEEKFQTLKNKKQALVARANAARTKEMMSISMNKTHAESTVREFQRLEDRIMEMEVKAKTLYEHGGQSSEASMVELEYASEVDKELEVMRSKKDSEKKASKEKKAEASK